MFLLLSLVAIIYLTRRKWFKESRKALDEYAFAEWWQPYQPDPPQNEDDEIWG